MLCLRLLSIVVTRLEIVAPCFAADMQDCLGELNDITVHRDLASGVGGGSGRRKRNAADPTRTFAVCLLTGQEYGRLDTVLAAAEEAYAELADCKPFWK